ncbi:MAG: hypothetical protein V7776_05930 [Halopseudomonas aestusnigri]
MKAIKIAVVIMSVFLIVGFGVVIYTISTRMSDGTLSQNSKVPSVVAVAPETMGNGLPEKFGSSVVKVAPGCHLVDAQLLPGKVMLRFDGAVERGCQKVNLFSSESGKLLGEWLVESSEINP